MNSPDLDLLSAPAVREAIDPLMRQVQSKTKDSVKFSLNCWLHRDSQVTVSWDASVFCGGYIEQVNGIETLSELVEKCLRVNPVDVTRRRIAELGAEVALLEAKLKKEEVVT